MNTLSKAALGLLSSGVAGLGGWGLYLKFEGTNLSKQKPINEAVNNKPKVEFSAEEKVAIEGLGISTSSCNASEKSCNLSSEEQEKIKFSDGTNNDLKIPSDRKVKLNIEKVSKKEKDIFGENGMKFNLTFSGGTGDIEIKDSNNKKITLKPNTNYEFKKKAGGQLERAWKSGEEMAKKVGMGNLAPTQGSPKSFSLVTAKLNIFFENKPFKELTPKTEHKSRNLELNENQEGYNNGFKYSTPSEIQFENQTVKLEANKGYEIKFIEDDWYLSKVESVSGGRQ